MTFKKQKKTSASRLEGEENSSKKMAINKIQNRELSSSAKSASDAFMKTEKKPSLIETENNNFAVISDNANNKKIQNQKINSKTKESIFVFKPLNENNNHFDIKNKIFHSQNNNLEFMPYSKNFIPNSVAVKNFPDNNTHFFKMQQNVNNENNRYSNHPRPQMIVNKIPFLRKNAIDDKNQNEIMNKYQALKSFRSQDNLMPNKNVNADSNSIVNDNYCFSNFLGFNRMLSMGNIFYTNYAANMMNGQPHIAMNNQNLNRPSNNNLAINSSFANYKNNNSNNKSNNNELFTKNNKNYKSSDQDKAKCLLNIEYKNNRSENNNFKIPFAKELLNKINNRNLNNNDRISNNSFNEKKDKVKYNESYSLNEKSITKIKHDDRKDRKQEQNDSVNKKTSVKLKNLNDFYNPEYTSEGYSGNKENDSRQFNKLLGVKRNQNDSYYVNDKNKFRQTNERNLKKLKHF